MSRTLDHSSFASHAGGFTADPARVACLEPWLLEGGLLDVFTRRGRERLFWQVRIPEHLMRGDSRAALVLSTFPLLVAAYTDELDCVAVVELPQQVRSFLSVGVGDRLVTVDLYADRERGLAPKGKLPPS